MTVVEEGVKGSGAKGLGRWLAGIAPGAVHGTVSIAILPDARVRALNRRFRGKDSATDVLSFPSHGEHSSKERSGAISGRSRKSHQTPFGEDRHLGEIVISRGIARKQAKNLGHSLAVEFRVLALHGLLHLLGYDHEVDDGDMARAETRLRRKAGLPLGLIARSS